MSVILMSSFCSLIVIYLIIKTFREKSIPNRTARLFIFCMLSVILTLVSDTFNILIKTSFISMPIWFNYIVQIIYFIDLIAVCFSGMLLADAIDGFPVFTKKRAISLIAIPAGIFTLLVILSPLTHWIFSIDSNGQYVRGPLNFFQFVFAGFYVISAFVLSIRKIRNPKYAQYKESYAAVMLFFGLSLVGAAGQVMLSVYAETDITILEACISFSAIIIFVELIQEQIAMDSLTGVCTRKFLFKFLEDRIERSNSLFLFMIDIDGFKKINDEFGHIEGDEALRIFARALKKYVDKKFGFVARYGGDEFVVVFDLKDDEVKPYTEELLNTIEALNTDYDKNYRFAASIGYSKYQPNESITEFIDRADVMMYQWKENHKKGIWTE